MLWEEVVMSSLGERIKARRSELGLNQTALATKAGISKTFLCELENQKKRRVGADILLKLGSVLAHVARYADVRQSKHR